MGLRRIDLVLNCPGPLRCLIGQSDRLTPWESASRTLAKQPQQPHFSLASYGRDHTALHSFSHFQQGAWRGSITIPISETRDQRLREGKWLLFGFFICKTEEITEYLLPPGCCEDYCAGHTVGLTNISYYYYSYNTHLSHGESESCSGNCLVAKILWPLMGNC